MLLEQLADFKLQMIRDTQDARPPLEATYIVKDDDVGRLVLFGKIPGKFLWELETCGRVRPRCFRITA